MLDHCLTDGQCSLKPKWVLAPYVFVRHMLSERYRLILGDVMVPLNYSFPFVPQRYSVEWTFRNLTQLQ